MTVVSTTVYAVNTSVVRQASRKGPLPMTSR